MRAANFQRMRRKFNAKLRQSHRHLLPFITWDDEVLCDLVRMSVKTRTAHFTMEIEGDESHRVAMARLLDFFDLADSIVKYEGVAQQNEEVARGAASNKIARRNDEATYLSFSRRMEYAI